MAFRKSRGIKLTEEWQGLIRFTCLTFDDQPEEVREKILELCRECGGEYRKALFEVMCTRKSMTKIAYENNVSEPTLYRKRKMFYERWRS